MSYRVSLVNRRLQTVTLSYSHFELDTET
ncbi:unnamed protein product, partial [Rotaria sp. Silwood1]